MKSVRTILKELFTNFIILHRLAVNDLIVKNKGNLLGFFWLWINPTIQIVIYGVVFGMGVRGSSPVERVDFFYWLIAGFIIWNFISSVVTVASRSIVGKLHIVTKMNFPVSIIPGITVLSEFYIHLLLFITVAIVLVIAGFPITVYWWYLIYYMFAACCFLYALSLFNAALTTVVRDYQHIVYNIMRTMFFITPIVYPIDSMKNSIMVKLFRLNPFTYLLEGYRDIILFNRDVVFFSWKWGLYFWCITAVLFIVGSILQVKMKKNLLDYL